MAHIAQCPRCSLLLFVIGDGKRGACRYLCGGTSGVINYPDLSAAMYTGCREHVGGGQHLCKKCRPRGTAQGGLIPQVRVLRTELTEDASGVGLRTQYVVECKDIYSSGEIFEYALPRAEVREDLLAAFEILILAFMGFLHVVDG